MNIETSPPDPMKAVPKVLIIASNPRKDLNLDREVSDLTTAVQRLGKFEIALGLGVSAQALPELLAEHSPQIVHFCGHGAGEGGLVFQDEKGQERLVSTEILARLFKNFADEIDCVVLNACDSDRQSEAIVEYINYVVGMSQPIMDQAAHVFAVGFYKSLAAGKSVEQAYDLGCIAIQIWSEDNLQSMQSGQYRQAEYVGGIIQPVQPELLEHLKPVLRKRKMLTFSTEVSSVQEVAPSSVSDSLLGFKEAVRQEIKRKEYKDQARAAYDNFGQFSAKNATKLTKSEYAQRRIVLSKVKAFWLEGFLKPSLQDAATMSLDLKDRPEAIANRSQGIEALSVDLDNSFDGLHKTQIYEEIGQGRTLLILGEPGAGKTIALLQLAQRLIERSEQNLGLPIPIVFNLSSWSKDRKPIVDWLIDELRKKYQVPKSLSEPWLQQQQLILLLDGLDEVNEACRNDCVYALNKFIGLFPQTEIAVCSRVRDYKALRERLQISSALCLQPLSLEQVHRFLDGAGGSLTGLKALLKSDEALAQLAQTPLILNFMSVAYRGWPIEKLVHELCSAPDRSQHLFDTYVEHRLEQGSASDYPKDKVLHWLCCLASQMSREKQTMFLIELMQPTWLQNRSEERTYRIRNFMMGGLMGELTVGLTFWMILTLELTFEPLGGRVVGLIGGLIVGLIGGLFVGKSPKILPLETISWSWQRARSKIIREFFTGFGYGLIFGLIYGLIGDPSSGLMAGLFYGLIFGLIFGLSSGLGSSKVTQRVVSNQGIRRSGKNCIVVGLIFGLTVGLTVGVIEKDVEGIFVGLIVGMIMGPIVGLKYGGAACIQHYNLRQMIHQKDRIPRNYAKFLDFASDRLLMNKIGGGYVFFHRMLSEHFAQMNSAIANSKNV